MKKIITIIIILALCAGAYAVTIQVTKKNPYAFVYQVDVELLVDGKPFTLTKKAGCLVENYSKAGGDKFGYVKPSGLAVSKELASGEVVVVKVPSGCKRFRKVVQEDPNAPLTYEINKPLPKDFSPMIMIADKAGMPDELEMYSSAYSYAAPASRLKLKSVSMKALAPGSDFEPDPFDWLLKTGHDGPAFVGFAARVAIKIPGMDELFDRHIPQREGVVALYVNEPKDKWYIDFHQGKEVPFNINSRKIFPDNGKNSKSIGFKLNDGQSLLDDVVTVQHDVNKNDTFYLNRADYSKYSLGHHSVNMQLPVQYILPSGETYYYHPKVKVSLIFDAKARELYQLIPIKWYTNRIAEGHLDKYNKAHKIRNTHKK
jgi:hypothetical protein